jgi:hypothetical protein
MSDGACLACGSEGVVRFLRLDDVPVFCNVLWPTPERAREAARGTLDLGICRRCGHTFNLAFDPARVEYAEGYENSLHHSPRFQAYAEALAGELRARHDLNGAHVVEIACGQGDFLRLLCRDGRSRGTGYDPSYRGGVVGPRITILPEYFGAAPVVGQVDLLCCRHALEHMADPAGFLVNVRRGLGDDWPGTVFVEVPNSLYSLRDGGVWDFIYEHVSYFCGRSLTACFERAGFDVTRTWETFEGQFLCIEARVARQGAAPEIEAVVPPGAELVQSAERLRAELDHLLEYWRTRCQAAAGSAGRVAIWGVGSKGVTFLNLMGSAAAECAAVDINPQKHGLYVGGTAHRVMKPEELKRTGAGLVVVMNPVYLDEVRDAVRALGVTADIAGVHPASLSWPAPAL